jgi:hypothetical protein
MFDECPSWPATHDETHATMMRTPVARRGRERFQALAAGPRPTGSANSGHSSREAPMDLRPQRAGIMLLV